MCLLVIMVGMEMAMGMDTEERGLPRRMMNTEVILLRKIIITRSKIFKLKIKAFIP